MPISNLYHEGELAVQQRANETAMARMNGGAVGKTIPAGALRFIEQQPMAVIGSIDPDGRVWASVLFGQPGFVRALDDHSVEIDLSQPRSAKDDPLWSNLGGNSNVGLLVIELGSRRRLRVNGRARKVSDELTIIDVERAYPNCPKYIQRRDWKIPVAEAQRDATPGTQGKELNETQKALIAGADTFFVASAHPDDGIDRVCFDQIVDGFLDRDARLHGRIDHDELHLAAINTICPVQFLDRDLCARDARRGPKTRRTTQWNKEGDPIGTVAAQHRIIPQLLKFSWNNW